MWLLLRRVEPDIRPITRGAGAVFVAYSVINVARVAADLAISSGSDLFHTDVYDTLVIMTYQMLFIVLTFGLFLMVNRLLVANLERDVAERQQIEQALRDSEEHANLILQQMFDSYWVLNVEGKILDVNKAFCEMVGYSRAEMLNLSVPDLAMDPPAVIAQRMDSIIQDGAARFESQFRRKDGQVIDIDVSATYLPARSWLFAFHHDITARKRAEAAWREQEALYRQAFLDQSAVMLLIDPESGFLVDANSAAAEFYGYPVDELRQLNVQQINTLSEEEARQIRQKVQAGELDHYTAPHRLATGELREVEVYAAPIQVEGRTLLYSIIHDVTGRKRAEEALNYRNKVLTALQQVMLDLINCHEVDDLLQALLIKIGVLVDAPHVSIDLLEDREILITYAATPNQPLQKGDAMRRGEGGWLSWQAIETGAPTVLDNYSTWEKRRALYEGFPIHAVLIMPIKQRGHVIGAINLLRTENKKTFNDTDIYAAGQLAQLVALVLDNAQLYTQLRAELAERKRAEEELRVLSRTVKQSQVAVMITDISGAIQYVNPKFCEVTGYRFDEVRGQNPRILRAVGTAPEVYKELWNTILAGHDWRGEFHNQKKNGELFWDATIISPIVNEDGVITHFVSMKEDVTERKRAEEAVLKIAAFEERQRLARDLHDSVNQSIHSLVLFSETLTAVIEKQQFERARHIAERLQESARQALKETRLLLYQIRSPLAESGADLIQNLEARLATVERHAGMKADITQEGSLDYCPPAWAENLFGIAIEALNNALKHSQARTLHITLRCFPQRVDLEIADDGRGFDLTQLHTGGMGLSNLQKRAELIGGQLDIVSASGQGCRVHFSAAIKELS